jgi:hypothetical protein
MGTNDPTFTLTFEGAGSCPNCRYVQSRLEECAPAYFERGYVLCSHCGERFDLWQAVVDQASRKIPMGASALTSLGAGQTSLVMPMETGKGIVVELTKYGVPSDAKILRRIYTGQTGDMTAMEWHGNAPPLRFPGTVLNLLGVPLGEGSLPRTGRVSINVVWIRGGESDAWPYLVTAFEAAAAGDYAPSLVFAQSAVEVSMMPLIEQRIRRHASAERVKSFMRDSLTYSYALNVVLPYLCGEVGVAQMPNAIRGALNKMRKKRNDIVHEGAKTAAVRAEDAIEGLCAAAFGFEYIRYVGPALSADNQRAN